MGLEPRRPPDADAVVAGVHRERHNDLFRTRSTCSRRRESDPRVAAQRDRARLRVLQHTDVGLRRRRTCGTRSWCQAGTRSSPAGRPWDRHQRRRWRHRARNGSTGRSGRARVRRSASTSSACSTKMRWISAIACSIGDADALDVSLESIPLHEVLDRYLAEQKYKRLE